MSKFVVMAINADGNEVHKAFITKTAADEYAKVCESHDCGAIMVVEYPVC